ncbi:AMP-binding enzyme family protein (macronuclear) [Tetrahymena thermophila SB210]|uniref:AMP-binding enzyme family protein n=1 Tax=Tetrahymena thermophila (strain SB210) TaxID=312017 RepID=I7MMY4_TETTS|nr:AMP-binding enzyme family protein [Tetrahymena thermophila SB210]EAS07215.2 AMP-binding enzyme family protein [Tetrahymena thermophila SB210]|eukprot:XP_001027457.2 AMP-binding enzyme family protein [Tetrahymena thermophila SB210]
MDPKFRQQTFISNEVDIVLDNEMIGFDFYSIYEGKYLNQMQLEQNKTYIAFVAFYTLSNGSNSEVIPLNITKCQNPQLYGMNCFDFSQKPDLKLTLGDSHKFFSFINLLVYKCQDIDQQKTFIPNNCADEQSVEQLISLSSYRLNVKVQASQFNTSSQQMQNQYKSQFIPNQINTFQYNEFKIQSQVTKVKAGFLIQSENSYSSPISYQISTQTYDRKQIIQDLGLYAFNQVTFDIDESVTYFNIQYPIFTEVLALCNSILALLLLLGSFCRKIAQNFIQRDIFFIQLKNFFFGTYLSILEQNNIIDFCISRQEQQISQNQQIEPNQAESDEENKHNTLPTCFTPKSSQIVFQQLLTTSNGDKEYDYVKEEYENKQLNEVLPLKNQENSEKLEFNFKKLEYSQNCLNLENSKKEFIPTIFKNELSYQKDFQHQIKGSSNKIIKNETKIPRRYCKIKKVHLPTQNHVQFHQFKNFKQIIQQTEKNFQTQNDISLQQRLEKILFQTKLCNKKEFLKSKGLEQYTLNQLEQSIDDSLDFFTFYKEILFLKKAVMILLSKEQIAALSVIGISLQSIKLNQENTLMTSQTEETYSNHFQEQYKVLQSKELQIQQIKQFLQRCENSENMSILDKRIFSSLIINQQNQY